MWSSAASRNSTTPSSTLAERYRGEAQAIFVYATCVTAMIGDDLEKVCLAAQNRSPIPIIPVNTPGFIGDKNIGNRLAGEVLLKYVIGTAEPEQTTDYDINLIGEYNIAGDLWGMLPLFDRLGIRILSCISGDAKFAELRYAHRAKLNVIICSKSLTNLAKKMKTRWAIPYLEESFYGMTDTAKALRDIARELDLLHGNAVMGDGSKRSSPKKSRSAAQPSPPTRRGWRGNAASSSPAGSRPGRWSAPCANSGSRSSPPARRTRPLTTFTA